MSLDFISFLLSKFAPTTAQSTMSPTLKDAVPIGTLDARIMKYMPPTTSESRSAELCSRAYKLQGFSNAADKILGAASRLEDEAVTEQRFWEQILSIRQKGWSISRIPRDPRGLGVHFGFRDAAPSFRKRGFAALRKTADGGLRLDQGAVPSRPVAVQVSVLRRDQNCGTSSIPQAKMTATEDGIDEQILQARNTLFEEELFHELGREARSLANQGVTMSSKRIKTPLDDRTQLQIELVGLDDDNPGSVSGPDEQLADGIAIALRVLLSHAHEQNLRRRSQSPPPMTLKPRDVPEYALIRPIVTHHQHRSQLESLTSFLRNIIQPFSQAGVPFGLRAGSPSDPLNPATHLSNQPPLIATDTPIHFLETLTQPLTTTFDATLPTQRPLAITMHTNLNQPLFGTEYSFSPSTLTYPTTTLSLPRHDTLTELEQTVGHILTVDLVEFIASAGQRPRRSDPEPSPAPAPEPAAEDAGADSPGVASDHTRPWTPVDPHQGTLSRGGNGQQRLLVRVWDDRLGLRHVSGPKAADVTAYLWDGREMELGDIRGKRKVETRTLLDIVR